MWDYLSGIKYGDVFIDVGAHVGKYTIPISKKVGETGLVIAIEPDPATFAKLLSNIDLNNLRNVVAINAAAWKEQCELHLHIAPKKGQNSIKKDFGLGYRVCSATTSDTVAKQLNLNRVDLIKIDAEGSELEILQGARETVQKFRCKVIVEVTFGNPEIINEFAKEVNYEIKSIIPELDPPYYLLAPK